MTTDFSFRQIATVHSNYKQKFGVPRQPGLVTRAKAVIEFNDEFDDNFFRELESFSHIWVLFIFHQHIGHKTQPSVRPPRLGGNKKIGVFASRSSFRPNPVGMSVVRLEEITKDNNRMMLHVSGVDFVEGTPVIDIKPYVSYADHIADLVDGYATEKPASDFPVKLSTEANKSLARYPEETVELIKQTLALDPRPAYADDETKVYSMLIDNLDVKWVVKDRVALVTSVIELA